MEKRKQKDEQDRQGRKQLRKKYRLASVGAEAYDEYADDVLNFKDSERDSIISYFEDDEAIEELNFAKKKKINTKKFFDDDTFWYNKQLIDTPTRLVNHSNEFLPKKKKINADKLARRTRQDSDLTQNLKNFADIERVSDVEKSQKSTFRKAEDEKRNMLFKIVGDEDIEKL